MRKPAARCTVRVSISVYAARALQHRVRLQEHASQSVLGDGGGSVALGSRRTALSSWVRLAALPLFSFRGR
eukprot:3333219-Alexandrium_andersonii.AAC.1